MPKPDEIFWLETAEHFDVLSDTTRLEIIELLMKPRSVRELADEMDVPRTRLYHHMNLLEDAGMIRVVETRPSGAQMERIYQVAAYSFQPSRQYLETADPRQQAHAVLTSIFAATEADFIRSVAERAASLEDHSSQRKMQIRRGLLLLDDAGLHDFITELDAVYEKYDFDPDDLDSLPEDTHVIATVSLVYRSARSIR